MFPWNMKCFSCFTLILCHFHISFGTYVVTTSRKWTSATDNQVCVTLSAPVSAEDKLTIAVEVAALIGPDSAILPPTNISPPEGETHSCISLPLSVTTREKGSLLLKGYLGGKPINESRVISIAKDVAETFVQTDKFLYRAEQTVQFRILTVVGPFLNVSLEPYEEIWIENPSGTRLSQWLNVTNDQGLVHLSFTLSDEPEQGEYKVRVRTPYGKTKDCPFKVEEYVLPRFEVEIKPPPYVLGVSESFNLTVCAKYTFGQPVKGNATLSVNNKGFGSYKITVNKESPISGCTTFAINSTELLLNGHDFFVFSLGVTANVTEEGTGVVLSAKELSFDISRKVLNFDDISVQRFYKPELPYVGEVKVTFPDKSPAVNEPMSVCVSKTCKNFTTNLKGILKFAVPPHLRDKILISSLNFTAVEDPTSFRSIMYSSWFNILLKKYYSPSNSSLIIATSNEKVACSATKEQIHLDLPVQFATVGQNVANVTVQVISRGQIQFSKTLERAFRSGGSMYVDDGLLLDSLKDSVTPNLVRGHFTIPLSLPKTISPKTHVVVWYARDDGEVVSDVRTLDVEECLANSLNITWSSDVAHPGEPVTLALQTQPFSICSLGVVDKSVQLLSAAEDTLSLKSLLKVADRASVGSTENLQVDDFAYCLRKLEKEPSKERPPLLPPVSLPSPGVRRKSRILGGSFYSSEIDALHMFDEAGVYIFSDLVLETRPCTDFSMPIGIIGLRLRPVAVSIPFVQDQPVHQFDAKNKAKVGEAEVNGLAQPEERTYFPETWLWTLVPVMESGSIKEELTLPDSVTEWVGDAVCVSPTNGIALSPPASITAFRDFFIDLTLPPSVKSGEIFPLKISVFNYLEDELPLKVILEDSAQFSILADSGEDLGNGERVSCLPPGDKAVLTIRVLPKDTGEVNLTVTAAVDTNAINTCPFKGDHPRSDKVVKPVLVQIEGVPKEKTWSKYICTKDLEPSEDSFGEWAIEPPPSIVPDSARGFVSVVGDLMGPTLENLGKLVKMPFGCGEQNMLNFAPNIFVMQYLDSTGEANVEVVLRAILFMQKGYQRELNYRHSDGSFSAFGERDDSGSTWLTAFVLKSFAQATQYIDIDSEDLNISRNWLKRRQLENGCFESVGRVLHKGMTGGLKKSATPTLLSAFVLIALIEAGESDSSSSVKEALLCLSADKAADNPYSVAVKAYALALAGSPDARNATDSLLALATSEESTSTLHWILPDQFDGSKGVSVETAGYAVLALLALDTKREDDLLNVKKIIKWMNNERNGQGGFVSTQDTIVALQALAQFEKTIPQGPIDANITFTMKGLTTTFSVHERNKLLQQRASLVTIPTPIGFNILGTGCVLIQAVMRYNVPEEERSEAFGLDVVTSTESDVKCRTKRLTACVKYLLPDGKSNMAIVEVNLVSGYIPEKSDLKSLIGSGHGILKRYEIDGSVVTIYADEFSGDEFCLSFRILREVEVENPKPSYVKVYDYYKPEYFTTQNYELPPTSECAPLNSSIPLGQEITTSPPLN